MNRKERKEKLKKEISELKDEISKILEDSTDYSDEELAKIKEKYNKIFEEKEPNFLSKVFSWFVNFLENLFCRYIFLALMLVFFFSYIAFSNKYYMLLIILYFDIAISFISATIYKMTRDGESSYLMSNFLSLILEILVIILINGYYPIFTSSVMLGLYIFIASVVYNLCTLFFSYRMFKRRLY